MDPGSRLRGTDSSESLDERSIIAPDPLSFAKLRTGSGQEGGGISYLRDTPSTLLRAGSQTPGPSVGSPRGRSPTHSAREYRTGQAPGLRPSAHPYFLSRPPPTCRMIRDGNTRCLNLTQKPWHRQPQSYSGPPATTRGVGVMRNPSSGRSADASTGPPLMVRGRFGTMAPLFRHVSRSGTTSPTRDGQR